MAENEVDVEFGAKVGELIEGVNKVKEQLDSVGEHVKHVAELFGIAFTLDAIKEFIEREAELGEQTERSMAILGASAESVGLLQGVAKLTGTSFEALQSSIGRMGLRLQQSTRDEFNPAAQGLKTLGIEAKELIGVPLNEYYVRLAETFGKFNPSMNLTVAAQAAFGRGVTQLLPMLLQGKEHFEELQHAVKETGSVMTDAQAKAFAETNEKINLLSLSVQGLGNRLFDVLRPAVNAAVEGLTHLVQSISGDTIRDAVNVIGNLLITVGQSVANFFIGVEETIRKLIELMKGGFQPQLGAFAEFVVGSLGKSIEIFMLGLNKMTETVTGFGPKLDAHGAAIAKIREESEEYRKTVDAMAESARTAFNLAVPKSGTFEAMVADAKVMGAEIEAIVASYNKLNAAQQDTKGRERQQAQIAALQEQVKLADAAYKITVEQAGADAKLHDITEAQKTQITLDALNTRTAAETAALRQIQALHKENIAEVAKIEAEITQKLIEQVKERQKVLNDARAVEVKSWESALTPIQSAWDSQLKGLLAGTTSWAQAMKSIVGDLVIAMIKKFEELIVVETIAKALQKVFGGTPDTSGVTKSIADNVAVAYTGFVANLSLAQGPAAIPEGAALAATLAATATASRAAVPAADVGGYVVSGGLALIHPGEEIIPAGLAQPYAGPGGGGGSAGGGGAVNVHIHTIDAGGVQAFVKKYAGQLSSAVQGHVAANPTSFAR